MEGVNVHHNFLWIQSNRVLMFERLLLDMLRQQKNKDHTSLRTIAQDRAPPVVVGAPRQHGAARHRRRCLPRPCEHSSAPSVPSRSPCRRKEWPRRQRARRAPSRAASTAAIGAPARTATTGPGDPVQNTDPPRVPHACCVPLPVPRARCAHPSFPHACVTCGRATFANVLRARSAVSCAGAAGNARGWIGRC